MGCVAAVSWEELERLGGRIYRHTEARFELGEFSFENFSLFFRHQKGRFFPRKFSPFFSGTKKGRFFPRKFPKKKGRFFPSCGFSHQQIFLRIRRRGINLPSFFLFCIKAGYAWQTVPHHTGSMKLGKRKNFFSFSFSLPQGAIQLQ